MKEDKKRLKEEKKKSRAKKKQLNRDADKTSGQLKGRAYYTKLFKSGSLYKKMNFSFSMLNLLTAFAVIVILFGASSIFINEMIKRDFIADMSNIKSSMETAQLETLSGHESLDYMFEHCVTASVYTKMDISVKITHNGYSESNNPYFDEITALASYGGSRKAFSDEKIVTDSFIYAKDKFIFTEASVINNGKLYNLYAFKNVQISRTYTVFFLITAVIVFVLANIVVLFTNRAVAVSVLMPLGEIADEVKSVTEENLAMEIKPLYPSVQSSDSVDNLITALNEMLNRLNVAFKQQQYFISNVSHELRIPLTIMKGYIDIISSWGRSDEKLVDESITAIGEEIDNMRGIVERLLLLQSIETGSYKTNIEKIDLNDAAQRACSEAALITSNHNISIRICNTPLFVRADTTLLGNAMRVILDNAVKYTPKGGEIRILTSSLKEGCQIEVADTGIGIPPDECEKVKERFYRTDTSRDRRIGGNGLGLSIANSSVIAMGGSLNIVSEPGKGTSVKIILPKSKL